MNKRLCRYLPPNKPDLHRILPSSRHSQLRPVQDVAGGRAREWAGEGARGPLDERQAAGPPVAEQRTAGFMDSPRVVILYFFLFSARYIQNGLCRAERQRRGGAAV